MDGQPTLPPAAHQIAQDPIFLEGRDVVTCGELLPLLFKGQKSESNQFGSAGLDAHTLASRFSVGRQNSKLTFSDLLLYRSYREMQPTRGSHTEKCRATLLRNGCETITPR
jgi:hypothetical protein